MSASDFLRRLSNSIFGWPKIDESPLVFLGEDTTPASLIEEKQTTPLTRYAPLILLSLMQDLDGLPGPRVIQDIGATLDSSFTSEDVKLAETDYGINFLWTQGIRVMAKSLVNRSLLVIAAKDLWQITPLGLECARRIYNGETDAWMLYLTAVEDPEAPEAAKSRFITEKVPILRPTLSPIDATHDVRALEEGIVHGTKLFSADGTNILVPCPSFAPLGRTEDGCAYHRSSEVNVLALWLILNECHNTVPTELSVRVAAWYEGKLTEVDNKNVGGGHTHFKRHTANLIHDLKRQKLIARHDFFDTWHVTEKGFTAIVESLKEHGIPA